MKVGKKNSSLASRFLGLEWKDKYFYKRLLFLSAPIAAQELLNSLVNILDSFMIGTQGLDSINAVGFSNQIFFLFILILFGITSGASMFMGQFWGKGDVKSIHKVMGICFVSCFLVALIFFGAVLSVPETLIGFYSAEPEVIRLGAVYLRTVSPLYLLMAFIMVINVSLRSIGQTKMPMATTVVALLFNGTLNYVFIFKCGWGVFGAALATLISRIVELTAQILLAKMLKMPIAAKFKNYFTVSRRFVKEFFKIVYPVIINEFVWALGTTIYNVAYKAVGNEAQGSVQISNAVMNLFMVLGMAVGSGSGILLANSLGAGDFFKAKIYSRKCLFIITGVSMIMSGLLILFSPLVVSVYDVDEYVRNLAMKNLYVVALLVVLKAYNYTTICGILRSGGDTKYCLYLDIAGVWLAGVPLAFFMASFLKLPIYIVIMAVGCEEVFKFILSTKRVLSNVWVKNIVNDQGFASG